MVPSLGRLRHCIPIKQLLQDIIRLITMYSQSPLATLSLPSCGLTFVIHCQTPLPVPSKARSNFR